MISEDKDVVVNAISEKIVKFALYMAQECERTNKKFYGEADKTPRS
jgi:hypothetical protein